MHRIMLSVSGLHRQHMCGFDIKKAFINCVILIEKKLHNFLTTYRAEVLRPFIHVPVVTGQREVNIFQDFFKRHVTH
jgi:hypothetical protein